MWLRMWILACLWWTKPTSKGQFLTARYLLQSFGQRFACELLGSRVEDALQALDLLQSLPEVDSHRIGIMGGSGG